MDGEGNMREAQFSLLLYGNAVVKYGIDTVQ